MADPASKRTVQNDPTPRSNGDHDDFELISESNLEEMLSSLRAVTNGASSTPEVRRDLPVEQKNGAGYEIPSNDYMDAAEVFELLQKEHKLLKGNGCGRLGSD